MKNIRSIVIAGITAVMAFSVCSCDSYLDVDRYIYDMTSLDSIFKRKSLLEQYINGASMYLPREEILWWKGEDPFALTTDEAFCSFKIIFPLFYNSQNTRKSVQRKNLAG